MTAPWRNAPTRSIPSTAAASPKYELGDYVAALADLEHVVTADPGYDFQRAAGLLAYCDWKTGNVGRAQRLFEQVLRTSTLTETQLHYAEFLAETGHRAEAKQQALRIRDKRAGMPGFQRRRERKLFRRNSALLRKLMRNLRRRPPFHALAVSFQLTDMTERLYYQNSFLYNFTASVESVRELADGRRALVLDRTAFYATSGGQPFDTGWVEFVSAETDEPVGLPKLRVSEVIEDESTGRSCTLSKARLEKLAARCFRCACAASSMLSAARTTCSSTRDSMCCRLRFSNSSMRPPSAFTWARKPAPSTSILPASTARRWSRPSATPINLCGRTARC